VRETERGREGERERERKRKWQRERKRERGRDTPTLAPISTDTSGTPRLFAIYDEISISPLSSSVFFFPDNSFFCRNFFEILAIGVLALALVLVSVLVEVLVLVQLLQY